MATSNKNLLIDSLVEAISIQLVNQLLRGGGQPMLAPNVVTSVFVNSMILGISQRVLLPLINDVLASMGLTAGTQFVDAIAKAIAIETFNTLFLQKGAIADTFSASGMQRALVQAGVIFLADLLIAPQVDGVIAKLIK